MAWLPSLLSLSRVPIAFAILTLYDGTRGRLNTVVVLFALAAVLDKMDGVLARHLKVASYDGYLIDGLADRCLSVACVLVGTLRLSLSSWIALVAVIRELLLYTVRLSVGRDWHPPSRRSRAHSLVVFAAERTWFTAHLVLALLQGGLTGLFLPYLNGAFACFMVASAVILSRDLLQQLASCSPHAR